MGTRDGDVPVLDERAALAVGAETERLQLADDLEREGIVEFQDVDVVPVDSGVGERHVGGMPAHQTVGMITAAPHEVPGGGMLIRRSEEVRTTAEHVNGAAWGVKQLDVRDHQGAAAF